MKNKEIDMNSFIATLSDYYDQVPRTRICCRFFLQEGTFSYELHNKNEFCFTPQSLVFCSETYYWTYDTLWRILRDIRRQAGIYNKQIKGR